MSKKENLLFVKYIHSCIKKYEDDCSENFQEVASPVREFMQTEVALIQEFKLKHNSIRGITNNDPKIESLIQSEINYLDTYNTINQNHKNQILQYLSAINLNDSLDDIKNNLLTLVHMLRKESKYDYQLSGVIYGCLFYDYR